MVASDTVVGLVGAGILLVALVGVFVYESGQGGGGPTDLKPGTYEFTASGKASNRAASGTRVPMSQTCAPGQTCVDPQTSVDLTLKGLPDPRGARYVLYADGVLMGALEKKGADNYTTNGVKELPNQQKTSITVYLEPSGTQATPSGPKVFEKTGITTTESTITGNGTFTIFSSGATLAVSYANGNNITVTLNGATTYNNFVYRAWMVKEDAAGKTFTHIENGTMETGAIKIQGTVPQSVGSYTYLLVTLDPRTMFDASAPKGADVARTGL